MNGPTDASRHKVPVISDVAAHAGVSVPTVSRVLSGKVKVSEEKRERVLASVRALGYRPSAAAQTLASLTPRTIGILVTHTGRFGYIEVLNGIESATRAKGYTPVIHLLQPAQGESLEDVVRVAMNSRVAGTVLVGFDDTAAQAASFIPGWMPLVIAGNARPDHPAQRVVVDEEPAARELVRHLLDLGHDTVVHVSLPEPSAGQEDPRTIGWRTELLAAGRRVPEVVYANWDAEAGYRAGLELAKDPQVTAVFCGNDEVAIGLMRALREAGRTVPEQVSVVGFDDYPLSAYMCPSLTTAELDFRRMGELACEALFEQLERHEAQPEPSGSASPLPATSRYPHTLSICAPTRYRESTAAPQAAPPVTKE